MADCEETGSESSRVFDYTMLFDDVVGEILVKLDGATRGDIVDEMVEALDMSMLMDVRMKVFRFAKTKLLEFVTQPGAMDIEPKVMDTLTVTCPGDAKRMIDEWNLIARKGKQRVALDAIDLLAYLSGDNPFFPYKLMKKKPQTGCKAIHVSATTQAKGKDTKQALIPFKPASNEVVESEDSADDDNGSDGDGQMPQDPDTREVGRGDTTEPNMNGDMSFDEYESGEDESDIEVNSVKVSGDVGVKPIPNPVEKNGPNHEPMRTTPVGVDHLDTAVKTAEHTKNFGSNGMTPIDAGCSRKEHSVNPPTGMDIFVDVSKPGRKPTGLSKSEPVVIDIPPEKSQSRYDTVPGEANVAQPAIVIPASITMEQRYAKLSRSEAMSVDIPPVKQTRGTHDIKTAHKYANLAKSETMIVDTPPVKQINQPNKRATLSLTQRIGQVMAIQTEWDMWGIPLDSRNSTTIQPSSCICEETTRMFKEWKKEIARENTTRDEQVRAKMNFLREEKMKADDERERMKKTIAALSKKVADNTAHMAEVILRTQRGGTPCKPKDKGPVAHTGWDEIEVCTIDSSSAVRPNPTQSEDAHQRTFGNKQKQPSNNSGRPGSNTGVREPSRGQSDNVSRALVHRDPESEMNNERNRTRTAQVNMQNEPVKRHTVRNPPNQASVTAPKSTTVSVANTRTGTKPSAHDIPLPQRVRQMRSDER